jgi:hypothetical protein
MTTVGGVITSLVREKLKLDERAEQQPMFDALARLYHDNGVLTVDGFAGTLADTCPSRETCWAGCEERVSRDADVGDLPGEDGSIFFPWIGAHYGRGASASSAGTSTTAGRNGSPSRRNT